MNFKRIQTSIVMVSIKTTWNFG